jgi:hypothetical protein
MWGPHPGPSGRPAAAGGLPWPMSDWGRAVGRVLGGSQMSSARADLIRIPTHRYFSAYFELCKGMNLPWVGKSSNSTALGATVVHTKMCDIDCVRLERHAAVLAGLYQGYQALNRKNCLLLCID